jgi:hypothetical protein
MKISTKSLLRVHRYTGLVVAPLVLFFAISGVWQVFRLQQDRRDGSYTAPRALSLASDLHKAEDLGRSPLALPFKLAISAVGVLLALATLIGIVVALRLTRPRWLAVLLLISGALVPPLLYVLALKVGTG